MKNRLLELFGQFFLVSTHFIKCLGLDCGSATECFAVFDLLEDVQLKCNATLCGSAVSLGIDIEPSVTAAIHLKLVNDLDSVLINDSRFGLVAGLDYPATFCRDVRLA